MLPNASNELVSILKHRDTVIRDEIVNKFVIPNKAFLRNGNGMTVGESGWYAAQHAPGTQYAQPPDPFPVPTECHAWYNAEIDSRDGLIFRFFVRQAWLYLVPPKRSCAVEITVPFALIPEAITALRLAIADVPLSIEQIESDRFDRQRYRALVPDILLSCFSLTERVRLDIQTPISGKPMLLYAGSTDSRRLSCAISLPRFIEI